MAEESPKFVVEMDCKTPSFRTQTYLPPQEVVDEVMILELDEENIIVVLHNVLDATTIDEILANERDLKRTRTELRGYKIPRWEICFTNDGKPFSYSGVKHNSICYPAHVEKVSDIMLEKFAEMIPDNKYVVRSHGISLLYSSELNGGGSIGAHSDVVTMKWGLIGILSLGQARWMRIRSVEGGQFINVKLRHNSLVFMHGPTFQKKYTHQIDKLSKYEKVGNRLSINVRYLEQ